MRLKLANTPDIKLIERLGKETYRQHFSTIWSSAGLESYLDAHFGEPALTAQLKAPDIRYYLPYSENHPAGILKMKFSSQIPVPPFDHGLELEKIYLLKNFTGKGLGKQILNESVHIAKGAKQKFIWLDVLKTNENAKRLYQREGFQTVGEILFSTDSQRIDMWIMRKEMAAFVKNPQF